MWIFGYGSLIWRPDFEFEQRREGWIEGFERRFWQGSTDHRGVPGAPGRVVTLVPTPGGRTWGVAFQLAPDTARRTVEALDLREQGGYQQHRLTVRDHREQVVTDEALVYLATPDNPNWLGPAPDALIAAQIRRSVGPSGPNDEYLLRLAHSLRDMGVDDPHVFGLEALLRSEPTTP